MCIVVTLREDLHAVVIMGWVNIAISARTVLKTKT